MIRLIAACLIALVFSSCLDSHEEVWLNADASGTAKVKISIPLAATLIHGGEKGVKSMVVDFMEASPAFTTYTVETSTKKDQIQIDVSITFKDALELTNINSGPAFDKLPSAARDLIGYTKINFHGTDLNFHRKIDLTRAIPGSGFITKEQLKGHGLTTIIHLPKAATSHDAQSSADSGEVLTWNTPIERAFREPLNQSFTMPLPIPWFKVVAILLLIMISIGALFYYIYRRWKMKALRDT
jgi:hypothetical protein